MTFLLVTLLGGAVGHHLISARLERAGEPLRIGLVQANAGRRIFTGEYDDPEGVLRTYEAMTADLARRGCRWVLWPESAVPETLGDPQRRLSDLARRHRIYLLAGAFDLSPEGNTYNSLFCFGPDGRIVDVYHKRRRVPFGEYVPLRRYLPSLDRFGVPPTDLMPGTGTGIIQAGPLRIGVGICFESLFPDLALKQAQAGAQLLAVATNDSYYGRTPAPVAHAAFLRLRAVETGLPAVQAATTGFSLGVRPDGAVTRRSGLFEPAAMDVTLPQVALKTFWVRAPWLTWAGLIGLGLMGLYSGFRRRVNADPQGVLLPAGETQPEDRGSTRR